MVFVDCIIPEERLELATGLPESGSLSLLSLCPSLSAFCSLVGFLAQILSHDSRDMAIAALRPGLQFGS